MRRDGSYIYDEFIAVCGTDIQVYTDIKVYTLGSENAHAEATSTVVAVWVSSCATDP